ncbi:MAG: hypothetical protein N3E37_01885 [Candidatus Micrarchaeota archaeon]|nr:hypothetical protein [Candidatus Micrarchaeota archaeon]
MIGDNEIVFKLIDGQKSLIYERKLKSDLTDEIIENLYELLLTMKDHFFEALRIETTVEKSQKKIDVLKQNNIELHTFFQEIKKRSKKELKNISDPLKKTAYEAYLIHTLTNLSEQINLLELSNSKNVDENQKIDFIFKKDNKIIIKKLKLDEDTTYYHKLFHMCSIMHSLKNLLLEYNYEKIRKLIDLENKYSICLIPDLYFFKELDIPEQEKKKFANILKKVLAKK